MVDIDSDGHEEQTDECTTQVVAEGLGKGSITRYLEPGQYFEIADDGPNAVSVNALTGPGRTIHFRREGDEYIFVVDGREISLPPNATVSELQNRL